MRNILFQKTTKVHSILPSNLPSHAKSSPFQSFPLHQADFLHILCSPQTLTITSTQLHFSVSTLLHNYYKVKEENTYLRTTLNLSDSLPTFFLVILIHYTFVPFYSTILDIVNSKQNKQKLLPLRVNILMRQSKYINNYINSIKVVGSTMEKSRLRG